MTPLPRSRLDTSVPLYRDLADLADRLSRSQQDLWADNLRACLRRESAAEVFAALGLELYRLRQSIAVRRLRLEEEIDGLCRTLEAAVGQPDTEHLTLYCALKDLADHLRLAGGTRWLRQLEDAVNDEGHSDASRLAHVRATVEQMGGQAPGLPLGTAPRVAAVAQRLSRARDDSPAAVRAVTAALRPI